MRAVDVVGDAVVVEQAVRLGATVEEFVEPQRVDHASGVGPVLTDSPVGREHLVVRPGERTVGGEEVGRRADGHE